MIEIDWTPTPRDLRRFAVVFGLGFSAIGVIPSWAGDWQPAMAIWRAAFLVGLVSAVVPEAVRPLYLAWMGVAFAVGWTISHALLAAVYFGMMVPLGLVLRVLGRDPLQRAFDRAALTYWSPRQRPTGVDRYFRQY